MDRSIMVPVRSCAPVRAAALAERGQRRTADQVHTGEARDDTCRSKGGSGELMAATPPSNNQGTGGDNRRPRDNGEEVGPEHSPPVLGNKW
ncbi:hypothetical protein [Arthrobacter sp. 9AX]|uniref:hypothetical protein n=1 Tax=Arthrobacter sp. 9AX TaxID=2653131 RepID=UPI001359714A|nr:hypothetical protein [Arthrobacter sp. 9AX]